MFRLHQRPDLVFVGLIASLLISACGKLPGFAVDEKADLFKQVYSRNDKIDILFVVDNSGSMAEEQANLANSFADFISHFDEKKLKFQIGVTSTDSRLSASWWNNTGTYSTDCDGAPYPKPYQYFANNGYGSLLAFTGNSKILTPDSPNYITQFQQNTALGICGSGGESGLLAATQFLSPSKLGTSGWNNGFVREDAFLAVIVLSDEDESVGDGSATYIKSNTTNKNNRITNFVNALEYAKGDLDRVRFDAIVAPSLALCPTAPDANAVGTVYMEVAAQLGGNTSNICADFSSDLDSLGTDLVELATKFKLLQPPVAGIEVSVNGTLIPENAVNGFTFDENTLEVEFHGTAIPPENAQISVNYLPARPI